MQIRFPDGDISRRAKRIELADDGGNELQIFTPSDTSHAPHVLAKEIAGMLERAPWWITMDVLDQLGATLKRRK